LTAFEAEGLEGVGAKSGDRGGLAGAVELLTPRYRCRPGLFDEGGGCAVEHRGAVRVAAQCGNAGQVGELVQDGPDIVQPNGKKYRFAQ
jgi:hypothetical protein